jgi:hypothetical protein
VTSTAGNITLDQANVVGTSGTAGVFAAQTTAAAKSVVFQDSTTGTLQIGKIAQSGVFTNDVTGVTTIKGDITLLTGGKLTLNQAVSTSAGDVNTVRLQAAGDITQVGGILVTGALGVFDTAGSINLNQANFVGTLGTTGVFAAQATASGTSIVFQSATTGTLQIGSVANSGLFTTDMHGVTTLNGDITVRSAGGLEVADTTNGVNSGTGTVTLSADTGKTGSGTLAVDANVTVQSANNSKKSAAITLRGADLKIDTSGTPATIKATNSQGSVVVDVSQASLAMSIGGADAAVTGVNLTDAELARIFTGATGTITFGDNSMTGDIIFTTATPATTAGAAIVAVQSKTGTGQIILDDDSAQVSGTKGTALDGGSSTITLTAGIGGIVEAAGNVPTLADIATTGASASLNTTGGVGTTAAAISFANNATVSQQVVNVGIGQSNQPGSSVNLLGLGQLTLGTITANQADITVAAGGILTLMQAVSTGSAASNTVRLQASGDINETAATGTITAGTLGVTSTGGNITLDQANVVGTSGTAGVFAAQTTVAGKSVVFQDTTTGTLQIGNVAKSGIFTNDVTGVTTNLEDITLATGGALTLNQSVSTGSGASNTVRLQAAGDITEASGMRITAGTLGVFDTAGNITLDQGNVVGTGGTAGVFAAQATAAGKSIVFQDSTTGTLQIGQVASAGIFTNTVTGITTNLGNITLATGDALALTQGVSTSSGASSTVRLQAVGDISEAATTGTITAGTVGVTSTAGNITLDQANVVGTSGTAGVFAAQTTAAGKSIVFQDTSTGKLQIGQVTSAGVFAKTVTGVTTKLGDITLTTGGALTLTQGISTGSGASSTVRIQAKGDVIESAGMGITAGTLGISNATGNITLDQANLVGTSGIAGVFAAQTTGSGKSIVFQDSTTGTLQIGQVASAGIFTNTVTGVTTNLGNITLVTGGALALNQGVSTGSGASSTVRLQAAGDITEASGILITAGTLGVTDSAGNITLDQANVVGTSGTAGVFAAQTTAAGKSVVFQDATAGTLQIGQVTSAGVFTTTLTGVTTNQGDITLATGGALAINQVLGDTNPTLTGTVRLQANGTVSQTSAGMITALNLGVNTTNGEVELCLAANNVAGNFGAQATTNVAFRNFNSYTTGPVAATTLFAGANGIQAGAAGDITLISDHALTVNNIGGLVSTTGTVRLQAAGNVKQAAAILAGTLSVATTQGSIDLVNAGNKVSTFAAQDTDSSTPGTITFFDSITTVLTIDQVNADADNCTSTLTGVTTNQGDITLVTGGPLALNQGVSTGSSASGTVRLQAEGDITEAPGILITAGVLVVDDTAGNVTLNQGNAVSRFTASNTAGNVTFVDNAAALTLETINTASGNGIITVQNTQAGGTLTVDQALTAGAGNVSLTSAGGISETPSTGKIITTGQLTATNTTAGNITLDQANVVNAFTASNTAGNVTFVDGVATLTLESINSATGNGTITVQNTQAGGMLIVDQAISAGAGNVNLTSAGGISETATTGTISTTGQVTATNTTQGDITLDQGNVVSKFAASNTVGNVTFVDGVAALTLETINMASGSGTITVQNTNGGGALIVDQALTAGSGNVNLMSAGGIGETASTGTISTTGQLTATNTTAGNITLDQANVVNKFMASNTAGNVTFVDGVAALTLEIIDTSTGNGSITVQNTLTNGTLTVDQAITAGAGNVNLTSAGGIGETTTTGTISTTGQLTATNTTQGSVTLDQGNMVNTFTASNTVGNVTFVDDVAALTLKTIDTSPANGTITVQNTQASGTLKLNQAVTAGSGNVILTSAGGIGETATTGTISTTGHLKATNTTQGSITLDQGNVVNMFTASNTAGNVTFVDAVAALMLETIDTATGNGTITVRNTQANGTLTVDQALTAGSGNVNLTSAGGIGETATTGTISTTGQLTATNTTAGDITLDQAIVVNTFAASNTAGNVTFLDGVAVLTLKGIDTSSANGNITLRNTADIDAVSTVKSAGGAIILNADSDRDGSGTLILSAGSIVQSSNTTTSAITLRGADLSLDTSGTPATVKATNAKGGVVVKVSQSFLAMSLGGADHAVTGINLTDAELARIFTGASGTLTFGDCCLTGDITMTTAQPVTTAGAALVVVQSTTGGGKIILDDDNANVSGTQGTALNGGSSTISLTAGTGGIVEAAGDIATLADIATTGALVSLNTTGQVGTSTNPISFLGNTNIAQQIVEVGQTYQPAQGIYLSGLGQLTLGSITTNQADITVAAGGILNLTQGVSTGSASSNAVRLQAAGDIAEMAATATITAGTLGVYDTTGNITLDQPNAVGVAGTAGVFAAQTTAFGKSIVFQDSTTGELQIGQVTSSGVFANTVTGIATNQGDITLTTGGALTLGQGVSTSAGDANTVRLQAAGDITEAAGMFITAGKLGVYDAVGNITLDQANVVGTSGTAGVFAAQATATGKSVVFQDATSGTLQIGKVTSAGLFTNTVTGATTNLGDITLATGGALSLSQGVSTSAGDANAVRLQAAGDITEAAGIRITAGMLGVSDTAGNIMLDQANLVGTSGTAGMFAAQTTASDKSIIFQDSTTGELQISQVTSSGVFTSTVSGVTTNLGDITVATGGALTLNQAVSTGSGGSSTIRMQAAGNITEAAGMAITAGTLGVSDTGGDILLDQANQVGTIGVSGVFAAQATEFGKSVVFQNATTGTLQIGQVTSSGLFTKTVTGVRANSGGIAVSAVGNLLISKSVVADGAGDILLVTSAGDFDLDIGGTIAATGSITIAAGQDFNAIVPNPIPLNGVIRSSAGTVTISAGRTANIFQPGGALSAIEKIPGFSVHTATGITVAAPPFLSVKPVFISPGITIAIDGTVTLVVTFGRPSETNYSGTINWGDGTSTPFGSPAAGTNTIKVAHTFSIAAIQLNTIGGHVGQLGGNTFFTVNVTVHNDLNTRFLIGGQSASISLQQVPLNSPGLGLAGTEIKLFGSRGFSSFDVPDIPIIFASVGAASASAQSSFTATQNSPGGATTAVTDKLVLRVGSADPSDKDNPGEDIDLEVDQNFDINNLTSASIQTLFSKLPDGRYRIVWRRGTGTGAVTERTILDVLLRDGRPINFDDLEKPNVPSQPADLPESSLRTRQPWSEEALPSRVNLLTDHAGLLATLSESPTVNTAAETESDANESPVQETAGDLLSTEFPTVDAQTTGDVADLRWSAAGAALVPVSVFLEMAVLRKRWTAINAQRESADANPPAKIFSRAGQLYRRLRKNIQQSLSDSSD